ncbi:hypothetical protein QP500_11100, partial [Pauljensenia sp. UMB0018B]|nr:hypothetical protein [Pauljensenia sp. UMB0018B]
GFAVGDLWLFGSLIQGGRRTGSCEGGNWVNATGLHCIVAALPLVLQALLAPVNAILGLPKLDE